MSRRFKKGPTREAVEALGITAHTKAEEVEVWQLISAAEALIRSDFLLMVNGKKAWAKEEVERLDCLSTETSLEESLEQTLKEKTHALSAIRCAANVINPHEVDWLEEEERRTRGSNGDSASRRKSDARKERKRARDREIRDKMKNASGKK